MEEAGPRVVREIKVFRSRDNMLFGLPFTPAVLVIAFTILMVVYWKIWATALAFFAVCTITGKLLARHDPYWMDILSALHPPAALSRPLTLSPEDCRCGG